MVFQWCFNRLFPLLPFQPFPLLLNVSGLILLFYCNSDTSSCALCVLSFVWNSNGVPALKYISFQPLSILACILRETSTHDECTFPVTWVARERPIECRHRRMCLRHEQERRERFREFVSCAASQIFPLASKRTATVNTTVQCW
jgi:hypothetical protein